MSTPTDFPAAVIAALQANVACATAFNSSAQTPKFFGTMAARTTASPNTLPGGVTTPPQPPYARVLEVGGDEMWQSGPTSPLILYRERGILQIDVFDVSESGARAKSKLIFNVVNDGDLTFADGGLLECRLSRQFFVPEPDPGPGGVAFVFHRVQEYRYVIEYSTPP